MIIDNPDIELLKERLKRIRGNAAEAAVKAGRNPEDVKIIAVSKMHDVDLIFDAIEAGWKVFGENYVQEIRDKHQIFIDEGRIQPEWHFIGHLQSNKVKYLSPFINYIHSVDSLKLAEEISSRALQNNRIQDILIQLNTSCEESKSGCEPEETIEIISKTLELPNIIVHGLMTIGTFTDDESLQRKEFSLLRNMLEKVNKELKLNLKELSMGMTGDYDVAIDEGATMVRVGTAIFGPRSYNL
jgi:pyridoxal phosphate enzyme (YggS family)